MEGSPKTETERQATGVAVVPVSSDSAAVQTGRRYQKKPDTVAGVVAFSLLEHGCNSGSSRKLLDAYGDFTRWPALDCVNHLEDIGWTAEAEALRDAFRFVRWNNLSGWRQIKADWRFAFTGFLKTLGSDYPHANGAADVPADWIAGIVDERPDHPNEVALD